MSASSRALTSLKEKSSTEEELRQLQDKVRDDDQIVADNSVKEDESETKVKKLQEEFKLADTRAEFAERSVDKLKSTIDDLINSLNQEKLTFRENYEKISTTWCLLSKIFLRQLRIRIFD